MISFFGDGGGMVCTALSGGGGGVCDAESGVGWFVALIWSVLDSFPAFTIAPESAEARSLRLFLPRVAFGLSAGGVLAAAAGVAACAEGAATAAIDESPTCRLLITVLTPAMDAACRPAASPWAGAKGVVAGK